MKMAISKARYQQLQWPSHNNKQRVFAASLAVLITIYLSMQLKSRANIKSESEFLNRPFTLLTLQKIPAERVKVEEQSPDKQPHINKLRSIRSIVRHAEKGFNSPSVIAAKIAPVQTIEQAITLLPINHKTIAKAYNDSKSDMQKMAEASGKELNTPIATKYDRFQTAAEQAAIPDCLSPQGSGGIGLFAIPVIAFAAATGKCK